MSQLLTPEYLKMQEELHAKGDYGVTMPKHAPSIHADIARLKGQTVLDYGSGRHEHAKRIFSCSYWVRSYDPCVFQLSDDPLPADYVICTDVLEHVEPECIDAVLTHLFSKMKLGAYLSIALRPAKKMLSDGRNAHILLRRAAWWEERVWRRAKIVGSSEIAGHEIIFYCRPRDEAPAKN